MKDSVNEAVDWAIKENLLDGLIKTQKQEIIGMLLTEYDEQECIKTWQKDGFVKGLSEGAHKKAVESDEAFLKEKISPETIAKCVKLPLEQVLELQKQITVSV